MAPGIRLCWESFVGCNSPVSSFRDLTGTYQVRRHQPRVETASATSQARHDLPDLYPTLLYSDYYHLRYLRAGQFLAQHSSRPLQVLVGAIHLYHLADTSCSSKSIRVLRSIGNMAKQPIWQVFVPMRHLGAREGNNNDDSCHSYLPQVMILSPYNINRHSRVGEQTARRALSESQNHSMLAYCIVQKFVSGRWPSTRRPNVID